jgi:WD40 repeat protein
MCADISPAPRALRRRACGLGRLLLLLLWLVGSAVGCQGPIWTSDAAVGLYRVESLGCFLPGNEVVTDLYDYQAQTTTFYVYQLSSGQVLRQHVEPGAHYIRNQMASGDRVMTRSISRDNRSSFIVWNHKAWSRIAALDPEGDNVDCATAISADGRYVLVGSKKGTARLYDLAQSEGPDKLLQPTAHLGTLHRQVIFATLSPDGLYAGIAAMYGDRAIIWDIENGRLARDITIPEMADTSATASDWVSLVDVPNTGSQRLFDWKTGATLCTVAPPTDHLQNLVFLPEQKRIVGVGARKLGLGAFKYELCMFEVPSGRLLSRTPLPGQSFPEGISPDGQYLLLTQNHGFWGSTRGPLECWRIPEKKMEKKMGQDPAHALPFPLCHLTT